MPRFKEQAICIREIDWSETSQVVALLTEDLGVIRGLAKGSKRLSPGSIARYSGGIELLTRGQIVGSTKPSAELATLTEWDLQEPYAHLRRDLRGQRVAFYAADLVAAMLAEHDPHPAVFRELDRLLLGLARCEDGAALLRFQWRLLEDCGYRPELQTDVRTGGALDEVKGRRSYAFDPHAGGFTAEAAGAASSIRQTGPWKVRKQTLALLRDMDRAAGDDAAGASPEATADDDTVQRANRLLCVYARAILDRQLPTMALILGGKPGR